MDDLITGAVERARAFFDTGVTKDVKFRLCALKKLKQAILAREQEIYAALNQDLGKHAYEAYVTEVGMALGEIGYALKRLRGWAKPQRVKTPLVHVIAKSRIYREPYGTALIMSPWNYPFLLTVTPLVGAVAAGNCAVVKPSAYSPATSAVLQKILSEVFAAGHVEVLTGGREVNRSLLEQRFDYILFTGSTSVGRYVMECAAKNLTPVTLELGGKSPCIVDKTANIELAARRVVWGKFLNAGQTCVAPDYVYVHTSVKARFLEAVKKYIVKSYGEHPETNPEYPKMINEKHFKRVGAFLNNGTLAFGGATDATQNKIAPTVLTDITWGMSVMGEEIFGPVLPVLEYENLDEVIAEVKKRPRPLALYLFTTDKKTEKRVLREVSFGGGCVNDTVVHLASSYMPFGGVGDSGMGGYHGKFGFETFSHPKSVLKKSNALDVPLRYPPYGKKNIKWVKLFLK
jgi:aldehyde dehydrogenase (NAD+)